MAFTSSALVQHLGILVSTDQLAVDALNSTSHHRRLLQRLGHAVPWQLSVCMWAVALLGIELKVLTAAGKPGHREVKQDHCCVQDEQVEYLEDSEVDFSSDSDDDDEDDMEDIAGRDEGRHSAGHLGKRPSGILWLQLLRIDTANVTSCVVDVIAGSSAACAACCFR